MFFSLPSWSLALLILAVIGGATLAGYAAGGYLREHHETLREPFGVLQGALLGVVGLVLAFGLTLALGRYEDRRAATVDEANAIGTTYLRAQLIAEPARTRSIALLRAAAPVASGPRLYVDSLNSMIDAQASRLAALSNRVSAAVLALEVFGATIAVALLATHISILGRGVVALMAAAALITLLLLVTFDLDRPTRGLITVPDTPLVQLRASMTLPPASQGP